MIGNKEGFSDTRRIRRLKTPKAIEVETDEAGSPRRVCVFGGWQDVGLARRCWRVDQHWWRPGEDGPVSRLYFRVVPEASPPLTVYRDLVHGGWFSQEY
jgi:hypothetical protein